MAFLGDTIDELEKHVHALIQQATDSANGLLTQAAIRADVAIENARVAFAKELNTKMDKLDRITTSKIQAIQSMVDDLDSGLDANIKTVTQQAQQICNTLPGAKTKPQVTTITPQFYVSSFMPQQIQLTIGGNFPDADKEGFKPSLLFANTKYELKRNTTQSLLFLITTPMMLGPTNKLAYSEMILSVPYEEGILFFKKRKVATFNLLLGILPLQLGRIVLEKTMTTDTQEIQHVTTQSWTQSEVEDSLPTPGVGKDISHVTEETYHSSLIPEHWTIAPSSAQLVVEKITFTQSGLKNETNTFVPPNIPPEEHWAQQPARWAKEQAALVPYVAYKVTTRSYKVNCPMPFGMSKYWCFTIQVSFHIEYDLVGTKSEDHVEPVPVNITWGQSQVINIQDASSWKVIFEPFDGETEETAGPGTLHYIHVEVQGESVVISVPDPSLIQY